MAVSTVLNVSESAPQNGSRFFCGRRFDPPLAGIIAQISGGEDSVFEHREDFTVVKLFAAFQKLELDGKGNPDYFGTDVGE